LLDIVVDVTTASQQRTPKIVPMIAEQCMRQQETQHDKQALGARVLTR